MESYDPDLLLKDPSTITPVEFDLSSVSSPVKDILSKSNFARLCATAPVLPNESLQELINGVRNSTKHLLRSNQELKSAQEEAQNQGNDAEAQEYRQYIQDNENVLKANEIRIKVMQIVIDSRNVPTNHSSKDDTLNPVKSQVDSSLNLGSDDENGVYL